eukprot:TRINITY_DN739_c0_g1_i1.p1 TRINITY_DN739_c0_g1~~TRINITY_DN739_c0_g1_i1.p1  ORF type:complete len:371 (-),score=125.35 TRINITY_DN739_c0_g1_i1:85-1107(-)
MEQPQAKKLKIDDHISLPASVTSPCDQLLKLFIHTKVDNVRPAENKIFVANRTDKIVDVWKGMVEHGFLSVPVLQKTKSKYYGFVDMYDIVKFAVEFFGETESLKNSEDWVKLAESSEEFTKKTVNDVMKYPLTKRNPFFPIHSGFSLFSAVEAMAREPSLHRIPVIDADRKLITVVTQSQLISIINKNMDLLGEKKDKPVSALESYYERVISIDENALAMDAFRTMIEKNVSGLAVLDADGKLSSTISLRDLKTISTDSRMFWRLYQTVHNFLLKVRRENTETGGDRPRTIVTVKPTDTLQTCIQKLADQKFHRIFIVDDAKKPVGVISLKDILKEIIS